MYAESVIVPTTPVVVSDGYQRFVQEIWKRSYSMHRWCTVVAHDKTFKKVFETVKENGLLGSKRLVFRFIPSEESVCVYQ